MEKLPVWDPFADWKHVDIRWEKVEVPKTGSLSYYFFFQQMWIMMAISLYFHGMIYPHFGDGMHELTHNTVFRSRILNKAATWLFGILYWPYNPYFYRLSHVHFHHQYTLHQNSDGEDVPNYVDLSAKSVFFLFFRVLRIKKMIQCLGRLFTLKPVSDLWRMRGYELDRWEQFIIEKATEKERKAVHRFTVISLVFHLLFAALCIFSGYWFLIILITLAPFYGPAVHGYVCGILQHACCEANNTDYRKICNTVKLDPISSILYWHMEYHTEHHMFASIPCYNLKKFSRHIADQMPEKERAIPKLLKLARQSPARFGNPDKWREDFGRFKGF
ncbi:MAG: fatty acid desaturase family protein [Saccharofermentanales bacterium]